jgi:hypothetical protein
MKALFIACLGGRISSGWCERVKGLCTFHLLPGNYLKPRYESLRALRNINRSLEIEKEG